MAFISNWHVTSFIKRPEKLHGSVYPFICTPVESCRTKLKCVPGEQYRLLEVLYLIYKYTRKDGSP